MFNGERTIRTQKVGKRSVHLVPEEDSIDIYYQMKGYPMMFAWGVPYPEEHWEEVDPDDLFMLAWDNFEFYEGDMFK